MLWKTFIIFLLLSMTIFAQTPPLEPGVSQVLAKWRATNYSDVRYRLNITLEKGAPLMKGDIEIRLNISEEGAKNDLILDWRTTQFANDKDKPFANVIAVNDAKRTGAQASRLPTSQSGVDTLNKTSLDSQRDIRADALNASGTLALQSNEHLIIPKGLLKKGENVIKIQFASPIKTSGAAVTRYVDKEDGAEYVYSLFVPSDASTVFPVFDQPDLKAQFQLNVTAPENWKVIGNTQGKVINWRMDVVPAPKKDNSLTVFETTKPISTYVFAFAAGDFEVLEDKESSMPSKLYVRKSQLSKLKNANPGSADDSSASSATARETPSQSSRVKVTETTSLRSVGGRVVRAPSEEVFRLNREAVKYLESYFDYKFPFPKYDLVLIPEFPFGGMEHAGATFLREDRVIFPTEPTKNDFVTRANLIFHEAAHQWFGDTVTMRWFDDLWLKEGFAEFMAYKTLEKVMPEMNAWKVFYERNKQAAYLTDSTKGTTPIYQEIPNLSAAKSAYGNIVYRKAPSFLKQAEFYLGEKEFQTAVRAFLKKHEFANASWQDLVNELVEVKVAELKNQQHYQKFSAEEKEETESEKKKQINEWANVWVKHPGMPLIRVSPELLELPYETESIVNQRACGGGACWLSYFWQRPAGSEIGSKEAINSQDNNWKQNIEVIRIFGDGDREKAIVNLGYEFFDLSKVKLSKRDEYKFTISEEEARKFQEEFEAKRKARLAKKPLYVFPNYQDYGYGIFLLDEKSRDYVLANIQTEKDDFLRTMMWGSLWDSVREAELAPRDYVELVIKNLGVESDESTIQTLLGRVSTTMNYYLSDKQREELAPQIENLLIEKMRTAPTLGQRITFYRAFLNIASSDNARTVLKDILSGKFKIQNLELKTKDKFDILTRLLILGDRDAPQHLAELEKTETSDEAKRYAYAAKAGIATAENKTRFWNDFVNNKEISENWIESAFVSFNAVRHSELTLPYLEKALAELPNLKRSRKIFFVNGWLSAFIGGQRSEEALKIVNKFLADNPNLDKDLRLKILENADGLERAVKIREKYGK